MQGTAGPSGPRLLTVTVPDLARRGRLALVLLASGGALRIRNRLDAVLGMLGHGQR